MDRFCQRFRAVSWGGSLEGRDSQPVKARTAHHAMHDSQMQTACDEFQLFISAPPSSVHVDSAPSRGLAARGGAPIYCNAADEQSRKDVMSIIVGEDDHTTACRRNSHVIDSRNSQLPAISKMDGEREERDRVNQLSNVG